MKFAVGALTTAILMQMCSSAAAAQSQCATVALTAWWTECETGDLDIPATIMKTDGTCVDVMMNEAPSSVSVMQDSDGTYNIAFWSDVGCEGDNTTKKYTREQSSMYGDSVKTGDVCNHVGFYKLKLQCDPVPSSSKAVASSPVPKAVAATPVPTKSPAASTTPSNSAAPSVPSKAAGGKAAGQSKCSTVTLNAWYEKCAGKRQIADAHLPTDGACVNTEVEGFPGSASALANPDGTFDIAIWDDADCDQTKKLPNHVVATVNEPKVKTDACVSADFFKITVQCGSVLSSAKVIAPTLIPTKVPATSATLSQSPAPSASSTPSYSAAPTPSASAVATTTTTTVTSSAVIATLAAITPTPVITPSAVNQLVAAVTAAPVVPAQVAVSASQVVATQPVVSYETTCAARFPGQTTSTALCCRWGDHKCADLTKCDLEECKASEGRNTVGFTAQTAQKSNSKMVCGDMYRGRGIELNKPCCRHGGNACPGLKKCMKKNCRASTPITKTNTATVHTSFVSKNEITCAEKKVLDAGSLKCAVYESKPCCRHSGDCGDLAKCQTKNCCRD